MGMRTRASQRTETEPAPITVERRFQMFPWKRESLNGAPNGGANVENGNDQEDHWYLVPTMLLTSCEILSGPHWRMRRLDQMKNL